jgi:hypothetical protein
VRHGRGQIDLIDVVQKQSSLRVGQFTPKCDYVLLSCGREFLETSVVSRLSGSHVLTFIGPLRTQANKRNERLRLGQKPAPAQPAVRAWECHPVVIRSSGRRVIPAAAVGSGAGTWSASLG